MNHTNAIYVSSIPKTARYVSIIFSKIHLEALSGALDEAEIGGVALLTMER